MAGIPLRANQQGMFSRFLLMLLTLFTTTAFAQTVRFSGKVVNDKNEPLSGVSVRLEGGNGTSTNTEGRFTLNLATGKKYTLTLSAVGYAAQTVETEAISNNTGELLIVMQVASKDLAGVTVTAGGRTTRRETVNSIIAFQKNTNTVASVISAETIRRSPDRNTGEVLKRIPGASVQDGKFLVIRGLADRYNMAMLNGIPLSSTEPDRKTFSFDLIPSNMIDNIVINKAFVPEMPGEWAGGLVQVNTKDIPTKNFLTVQAGFGFNTQTISNDFYTYRGGKTDWLGIDDGTRSLPDLYRTKSAFAAASQADKNAIGLAMQNVWNGNVISTPFNSNFQLSAGFASTLFKKRFGGIFGVTFNRQSRRLQLQNNYYDFADNGGARLDKGLNYEYDDNRYNQETLLGALGNLTLELNANNRISYKTLFNITSNDFITQRTGIRNFGGSLPDSVRGRELAYQQNTFWSNQLSGEHNITALKTRLRWYGSFNILDGYSPDQRRLYYLKDNSSANQPYRMLISNTISQESGNRLWQLLNDYVYTAGGDVSRTIEMFGQKQTVKAGYMLQVRDRLFDALPFAYSLVGNNDALRQQDAERAFVGSNFSADEENGKLKFGLLQNLNYRYVGNTILNAGFIQFDNQFTPDLRVVWGVRVEDFDQLIGSTRKSDPRHNNTRVRDWLPGVNITYRLNAKTNLRLSGSQTVVRPEFREIAPFGFYDFELNASVTGNAQLRRTKVTNIDLRYELYPRAGETFNAGVFYKNFDDPIEQVFQPNASSGDFFFQNADMARAYGAELEFRKRLDFIKGFQNFTFQTNLAYIYSRIEDAFLAANGFSINRPMQGQSPYVINAALLYDHEKSGLNATVLFNQIGRRIAFIGNQRNLIPDVWENQRPLMDLQVSKKLLKNKGELRLNVSDLLNRTLYFYQNTERADDNKGFQKGSDALRFSRRFGTNVSLSFGYNF